MAASDRQMIWLVQCHVERTDVPAADLPSSAVIKAATGDIFSFCPVRRTDVAAV